MSCVNSLFAEEERGQPSQNPEQCFLLTIAVPTYNRLEKLSSCLYSIVSQIAGDGLVEVLVSDNASDDGTEDFMLRFRNDYGDLSYYRNSENLGPDRNFLNCFEHARGKYVMLLGDDDALLPGALDRILGVLKTNPDFVHLRTRTSGGLRPDFNRFETADDFFEAVGVYVTFVSSLIFKTENIRAIEGKDRFFDTNFIQSHLALLTLRKSGEYVQINFPCLSVTGNVTISYDLYHVWGVCYHNLLFGTAVKCGISLPVVSRVYDESMRVNVLDFIRLFRSTCQDSGRWNEEDMYCCLDDVSPNTRSMIERAMSAPVAALRVSNLARRAARFAKALVKRTAKPITG